MKKYIVVDEKHGEKMVSYASSFDDSENLLWVLPKYPKAVAIEMMPTKKRAEEVARVRNDIYKADGRLYDFKD